MTGWLRIVLGMQPKSKLLQSSRSTASRLAPLELGTNGRLRRAAARFDRRPTTSLHSSGGDALHCTARPVLLLHGFLATPLALTGLAAQLRRSGYRAHVVQLGGLFGRFNTLPVEETAGVVAERVERLVQEHRYERIDVVGHSEGGLIGRYYVQRLDGARRVRHLVTLGTPHRGTVWAYAGYLLGRVLPSLSQMAPGSPLLRALPDHTFPYNVRLTSIYSPSDSICPPSSCRLDSRSTHLKNVEMGRLGHLEFLVSARVCSVIAGELESVQPPILGRPRRAETMPHRPQVTAAPQPRLRSATRLVSYGPWHGKVHNQFVEEGSRQ